MDSSQSPEPKKEKATLKKITIDKIIKKNSSAISKELSKDMDTSKPSVKVLKKPIEEVVPVKPAKEVVPVKPAKEVVPVKPASRFNFSFSKPAV